MWQTCLRDVLFLRDPAPDARDERMITGAEAYTVLLEVVCGLRSPLAGETEVQAQFKAFLATLDPIADRDLLRVGQRVLADAKSIRQRHLQGVGVVAYGPLAARFVPAGRLVVLVGTGALAADLSSALTGRHAIDHWGRKPHAGPRYFRLSTAPLRPAFSTVPATIVVAAPVPQTDVDALTLCYPNVQEVIDLRGRQDASRHAAARVITLDDLFREAAPLGPAADRIAAARREIVERGHAFAGLDVLRPFGWDDLCA